MIHHVSHLVAVEVIDGDLTSSVSSDGKESSAPKPQFSGVLRAQVRAAKGDRRTQAIGQAMVPFGEGAVEVLPSNKEGNKRETITKSGTNGTTAKAKTGARVVIETANVSIIGPHLEERMKVSEELGGDGILHVFVGNPARPTCEVQIQGDAV